MREVLQHGIGPEAFACVAWYLGALVITDRENAIRYAKQLDEMSTRSATLFSLFLFFLVVTKKNWICSCSLLKFWGGVLVCLFV